MNKILLFLNREAFQITCCFGGDASIVRNINIISSLVIDLLKKRIITRATDGYGKIALASDLEKRRSENERKGRIGTLTRKIETYEKENNFLKTQLKELSDEKKEKDQLIVRTNNILTTVQNKLHDERKRNESIEAKYKILREEKERQEDEYLILKKKYEEQETIIREMKHENEILSLEINELKKNNNISSGEILSQDRRCKAITIKNTRCSFKAKDNSNYCTKHKK